MPFPNASYFKLFLFAGAWFAGLDCPADTLTVAKGTRIASITKALSLAQPQDVILVTAGTYREGNIIVNKTVHLVGEGFPVVDGQHQTEIFTIQADNVWLRGFQIQNVGTSYTQDRAGIMVENSQGCRIEGNKLYDTFFGIYLKHAHHTLIKDNQIIGKAEMEMSSGNAIHLWYSDYARVENNLTQQHRDGIYLEFVNQSAIIGNTSLDNLRYGLHFMFSHHDEYLNNTFRSNGAGVVVMFSHNISMRQNIFEKNWGPASYGLLLKEIYDGDITDNEFLDNTTGIYAESANRLKVKGNNFSGNGWALKILGSCMDNEFTRNNFFTNTFDLSTNSKSNYNTYDQNYWSDYTGYDLDRDGFGDVPYRPMKLFSKLVSQVDPSIILLRSLFVDIINFAEKVTPVFLPEALVDEKPLMKPIENYDRS